MSTISLLVSFSLLTHISNTVFFFYFQTQTISEDMYLYSSVNLSEKVGQRKKKTSSLLEIHYLKNH